MQSTLSFTDICSFSDFVANQYLALIGGADWKFGYHYATEYNIPGRLYLALYLSIWLYVDVTHQVTTSDKQTITDACLYMPKEVLTDVKYIMSRCIWREHDNKQIQIMYWVRVNTPTE